MFPSLLINCYLDKKNIYILICSHMHFCIQRMKQLFNKNRFFEIRFFETNIMKTIENGKNFFNKSWVVLRLLCNSNNLKIVLIFFKISNCLLNKDFFIIIVKYSYNHSIFENMFFMSYSFIFASKVIDYLSTIVKKSDEQWNYAQNYC